MACAWCIFRTVQSRQRFARVRSGRLRSLPAIFDDLFKLLIDDGRGGSRADETLRAIPPRVCFRYFPLASDIARRCPAGCGLTVRPSHHVHRRDMTY